MAVFAAVLLGSGSARADGLSYAEHGRLLRGETVTRAHDLRRGGRRYVGGVTYTIMETGVDDLETMLTDVASWRRFLPKTRDARREGAVDGDPLVTITHGSALVSVAYTLRVHRESNVVRFWMDPTRSHDINDVWGYFRADPLPDGRALVTYGILIDMGDGLLRDMFEPRVQELALEIPEHVKSVVIERNARGARATR